MSKTQETTDDRTDQTATTAEDGDGDGDDYDELEKPELFDLVADALGFETTENGRKPRYKYHELAILYDRLHDLGYIDTDRTEDAVRFELRQDISNALGADAGGGRPLTIEVIREFWRVLDDEDVIPQGGSISNSEWDLPADAYPTPDDYERARDEGYVYEWVDPEECVVVSRRQNSTRYHTLWTIRNGKLVPVCKGYSPSNNSPHRLVPEQSISRTQEECSYCQEGALRL